MNLFGKKKSKDDNVYVAVPKFYEKDGSVMGAIALTEGVETSLPLNPSYKVDGKLVENWQILFVSTTLQRPLGNMDYFVALQKLASYAVQKDKENVVVKKLSLEEMKAVLI